MPRYTIEPADRSASPVEIVSPDGSVVFEIVRSLDCSKADVLEDGNYAFTLELEAFGMWRISHRGGAAKLRRLPSEVPLAVRPLAPGTGGGQERH
jgi:hypothetical protein